MRFGIRAASCAAMTVLALAPAVASAQAHGRGGGGGFHGGGGGGFHGGGGFRGGDHDGFRGGDHDGFRGGDHDGFRGGYRGGYGGYRGYGGFRGGYYGGFGGYGGFGYGGYYGGFGVGDALLGAAIIGGTAAIIASNDRPVYEAVPAYPVYQTYPPVVVAPPADYYAPPPPPPEPAYASHDPVEQCTQAAQREAASHGDSGRVLSIDRVDGHENGARVVGTLEIRHGGGDRPVEKARFTCTADYGQVTAFRFG